jgi:hypothetical protein
MDALLDELGEVPQSKANHLFSLTVQNQQYPDSSYPSTASVNS